MQIAKIVHTDFRSDFQSSFCQVNFKTRSLEGNRIAVLLAFCIFPFQCCLAEVRNLFYGNAAVIYSGNLAIEVLFIVKLFGSELIGYRHRNALDCHTILRFRPFIADLHFVSGLQFPVFIQLCPFDIKVHHLAFTGFHCQLIVLELLHRCAQTVL